MMRQDNDTLNRNVLLYGYIDYSREGVAGQDHAARIADHELRFFENVWSSTARAECVPYTVTKPGLNMNRVESLLKEQYFNAEALKHFSCFINQYYFVSREQLQSLEVEESIKFNRILQSLDLIRVDSADSEVYRALNNTILVKRAKDGNNIISSSNSVISGTRSNSVSMITETRKERQDIGIVYHEAFVAVNYLNSLRSEIPNFMYVYGVLKLDLNEKNGRKNEVLEIAEFLGDNADGHVKSLHAVLSSSSITFKDILEIMTVIYCALRHANRFHHNDAHANNILVRKLHTPKVFRYRDNEEGAGPDYQIRTTWVPMFIDFGRSTYRTTPEEQIALNFPERLCMFPEGSRYVYDSIESEFLHILNNVRYVMGSRLDRSIAAGGAGLRNPINHIFNLCLDRVEFAPQFEAELYGKELGAIRNRSEYENAMRTCHSIFASDKDTEAALRKYKPKGCRMTEVTGMSSSIKTIFGVLLARCQSESIEFEAIAANEGVSQLECDRRVDQGDVCESNDIIKRKLGSKESITEMRQRLLDSILAVRCVDFVGWQAADFACATQRAIINTFIKDIAIIRVEHVAVNARMTEASKRYDPSNPYFELNGDNMFYMEHYNSGRFPASEAQQVRSHVLRLEEMKQSLDSSVAYMKRLIKQLASPVNASMIRAYRQQLKVTLNQLESIYLLPDLR